MWVTVVKKWSQHAPLIWQFEWWIGSISMNNSIVFWCKFIRIVHVTFGWVFSLFRSSVCEGITKIILTRFVGNVSCSLSTIEGLSEKAARVFKKHGIATAMKPHTTLRNMLVHPKDKRDKKRKLRRLFTRFPVQLAKNLTLARPAGYSAPGSGNTRKKPTKSVQKTTHAPEKRA